MEYKADEIAIYENSQNWIEGKAWPQMGMGSSASIPNPAMSYWSYIILAKITNAQTPLALTHSLRWLNIFALLGFLVFIFKQIPLANREAYYWAFALACVNPFQILWDRKLWPQSILPIYNLALFIGWWHRSKKSGAFLWGFIGALLGQVHMAGFFFSFALAVWTFFREQKSSSPRTKWKYWIAGSLLGALLLTPWLLEMLQTHRGRPYHPDWSEVFRFRFWRYWFTVPLGMRMTYTLGLNHFEEFLKYPLLPNGSLTNLVQIAHWFNSCFGLLIFGGGFLVLWKNWRAGKLSSDDPCSILLQATFIGYGVVLSVCTTNALIYHHYLCVCMFIALLFLTKIALSLPKIRWIRVALSLLVASEFIISFGLLQYIHVHQGTTNADSQYGRTYRWQQETE